MPRLNASLTHCNLMNPVTSDELLEEKNLRAVFWAARRIPASRFNQGCTLTVVLLLVAYIFLTPEDGPVIAKKVRELADYGFSFATSILSFLIAGFTIYVSITKSELLIFLSEQRHEESGLPWIKHSTFIFLRVMAIYVVFCLLCVSIKLFGGPSGALSLLLDLSSADPALAGDWIGRTQIQEQGQGSARTTEQFDAYAEEAEDHVDGHDT